MESERQLERQFCPSCFADSDSGSWDHVVVPTASGGHCTNCGSACAVRLPGWAIDEIRRCASWVGRRYYPGDEDRENYEERKDLLALVVEFPGREARLRTEGPMVAQWEVRQRLPGGQSVMTWVREAATADEAMKRCGLRYVPANKLEALHAPTSQQSA